MFSRACWTKRLGQVSKYHLKIQKMQKQRIRKISSQLHFKSAWRGITGTQGKYQDDLMKNKDLKR